MASRLRDVDEMFLGDYVSITLQRGDAAFSSPALSHAAGKNPVSCSQSAHFR